MCEAARPERFICSSSLAVHHELCSEGPERNYLTFCGHTAYGAPHSIGLAVKLYLAETQRLAALQSYALLGTGPELAYDQVTALGSKLFDVPICMISLVGEAEQWLKSHHGTDLCSTERSLSFCAYTLTMDEPLVVFDAPVDPRFRDHPMVTGEAGVRFYAGAPLINAEGHHLGALCIIDTKPRSAFSAVERELLGDLASVAITIMEKRRAGLLNRAIGGFANVIGLALITTDAEGRITFWNPAAKTLFGHAPSEVIGRPVELIIPERFRAEHAAGFKKVAAGCTSKLSGKSVELVAVRQDGTEFPIEMRMASWLGPAGVEFGAQIHDITERRQRERRLEHLAHHDALTGLLNRTGFRERLEECLGMHRAATILAIDLDGFKAVNDTFGHAVGDSLLQAIAIRFTALLEQTGTIARVGGDEFALLLTCREDVVAARQCAARLIEAFQEPFQLAGHNLQIGISVGIGLAPIHAEDLDELLLRADLALLAAKKAGGRCMRMFDAPLAGQLSARLAFEDELRVATERGEWQLFYQPQVRLSDNALIGVEALLRWNHPQHGLLTPATFLETLETHLVAYEVGTWVIDEGCRQLAAWRKEGLIVPRMGLNLFAVQFVSGILEKTISGALEAHGLLPNDLELEITETIVLRSDDQVLSSLIALRDSGVHIAFDDFGTGFASLATLGQVPVTRLKIDRSFVRDLGHTPQSEAIVSAVVSLARSLHLEVVAEGIEDDAQRLRLLRLGCESGQGYLFGKPVSGIDHSWLQQLAA